MIVNERPTRQKNEKFEYNYRIFQIKKVFRVVEHHKDIIIYMYTLLFFSLKSLATRIDLQCGSTFCSDHLRLIYHNCFRRESKGNV